MSDSFLNKLSTSGPVSVNDVTRLMAKHKTIDQVPTGWPQSTKGLMPPEEPLQDPWVDPVTALSAGFGGALPRALGRVGTEGIKALAGPVVSGLASGLMDYPVGTLTEMVGQKYPKAALPANIALGLASGLTFERLAEEAMEDPRAAINYAKGLVANNRGSFSGRMAKTADLNALSRAEKMIAGGVDPEKVRLETGWFQGMDGKWRFEIDDSGAILKNAPINEAWESFFSKKEYDFLKDMGAGKRLQPSQMTTKQFKKYMSFRDAAENEYNNLNRRSRTLGDVLDHPYIYSAYPDIKNTEVILDKGMGTNASYDHQWNAIKIGNPVSEDSFKGALLHETQHAIQSREGFAKGGAPNYGLAISADKFLPEWSMRGEVRELMDAGHSLKEIKEMYGELPEAKDVERVYSELSPGGLFGDYTLADIKKNIDYWKGRQNPEDEYNRLAGEIEARDTAARMGLSGQERLNTKPYSSQGIPKDQAIIRFDGTEPQQKITWHGTPHQWTPEPGFPHGRPRLDKIGTGEGAQAYGHGWYSADTSDVAKTYSPIDPDYEEELIKIYNQKQRLNDYNSMEVLERVMMHEDPSEIRSYFTKENGFDNKFVSNVEKILKLVESIPSHKSSLYKLDIPDDISDKLLDWDKPLSEQSEYVKKALSKAGIGKSEFVPDTKVDLDTLDTVFLETGKNVEPSGSNIYDQIADKLGKNYTHAGGWESKVRDDKAASEYLASIGIPGNKYLDGVSRGQGKGSYNYVIWDQPTLDRVKVLQRNNETLDPIGNSIAELNQADPTHKLKFDGIQEGFGTIPSKYQITPQDGPAEGATFLVDDPTQDAISKRLLEMIAMRTK